jgi:hypothetical protein
MEDDSESGLDDGSLMAHLKRRCAWKGRTPSVFHLLQ